MIFKANKKINEEQFFKECDNAGIKLISIIRDRKDNLIFDADKNPIDIINAHIPKQIITLNERVDRIQNIDDIKKFLKNEDI